MNVFDIKDLTKCIYDFLDFYDIINYYDVLCINKYKLHYIQNMFKNVLYCKYFDEINVDINKLLFEILNDSVIYLSGNYLLKLIYKELTNKEMDFYYCIDLYMDENAFIKNNNKIGKLFKYYKTSCEANVSEYGLLCTYLAKHISISFGDIAYINNLKHNIKILNIIVIKEGNDIKYNIQNKRISICRNYITNNGTICIYDISDIKNKTISKYSIYSLLSSYDWCKKNITCFKSTNDLFGEYKILINIIGSYCSYFIYNFIDTNHELLFSKEYIKKINYALVPIELLFENLDDVFLIKNIIFNIDIVFSNYELTEPIIVGNIYKKISDIFPSNYNYYLINKIHMYNIRVYNGEVYTNMKISTQDNNKYINYNLTLYFLKSIYKYADSEEYKKQFLIRRNNLINLLIKNRRMYISRQNYFMDLNYIAEQDILTNNCTKYTLSDEELNFLNDYLNYTDLFIPESKLICDQESYDSYYKKKNLHILIKTVTLTNLINYYKMFYNIIIKQLNYVKKYLNLGFTIDNKFYEVFNNIQCVKINNKHNYYLQVDSCL